MMKIYQKKNASIEDENVLIQLERRHTLKEVTNEVDLEGDRKTTRANSLGILVEGHSSSGVETAIVEKKSGFTRKPTVITESELSSSWLYKDRKAKINSDDESVDDPSSTISPDNHEDMEPRSLHDPNLRPVPVPSQRLERQSRKMSSCCWYFTIVLLICIACLAVLSGVGGIVYMEYFATYKDKSDIVDADILMKNDKNPSDSKEIIQHPLLKQNNLLLNEPKIPENILKDVIKNSAILVQDTDASRKVPVIISPPKEDIIRNKDLSDSNNKSEALNEIKGSKNLDIEITEQPKIAELSSIFRNIRGRINTFNVPVSDKSVEMIKRNSKDQNSLDLKLNYQGIDDIHKIIDGHEEDVNEQMNKKETIVDENSNSEIEVSDSSEGTLESEKNFNFAEMTTLQGFELIVEQVNEGIPFQNLPKENHIEHSIHPLPNDNSLDHIKNSIDNKHEDNSFDHRKHSIDHDPEDSSLDHAEHSTGHDPKDDSVDHVGNSIDHDPKDSMDHFEHSIGNDTKDNSLDHSEHSIDHAEHFIPHHNNKSLNGHNEDSSDFDSDGSSPEEHSRTGDHNHNSNDSAQLVFIRPVVESKPVPVPLAFLRRIGFDIKNPNSHQPMTAKDMDIKFSLAEALKYLRSLDKDNKMPASREKNVTKEMSNQEESKKTKLPLISERKEYLNVLRKKIYDPSL